jgi:hypothetical protein
MQVLFVHSDGKQCDRFADGVEFPSITTRCYWLRRSWQGWDGVEQFSNVIASMLVSPSWAQSLGLAWDDFICDWKMVKRSIRTECYSLIFCMFGWCLVIGALGPIPTVAHDETEHSGQLDLLGRSPQQHSFQVFGWRQPAG